MSVPEAAPAPRYVFQGREVTLPVEVRDASSAAATYLVAADAARKLLPGPELDVVELLPGRALFSLACIDYRDNDLGDYNEVSLTFFARPRGEGPSVGIPYLGNVLDFFVRRSHAGCPTSGCTRARAAETLRFIQGRRAGPVNLIVGLLCGEDECGEQVR